MQYNQTQKVYWWPQTKDFACLHDKKGYHRSIFWKYSYYCHFCTSFLVSKLDCTSNKGFMLMTTSKSMTQYRPDNTYFLSWTDGPAETMLCRIMWVSGQKSDNTFFLKKRLGYQDELVWGFFIKQDKYWTFCILFMPL